jgi:hypothetical protein
MSAGSPIVKLRVTTEMRDEIIAVMFAANKNRKDAPYDMSSWIRYAIQSKLDHLHRSRRRKLRNRQIRE